MAKLEVVVLHYYPKNIFHVILDHQTLRNIPTEVLFQVDNISVKARSNYATLNITETNKNVLKYNK